jgi:hypothetical protein
LQAVAADDFRTDSGQALAQAVPVLVAASRWSKLKNLSSPRQDGRVRMTWLRRRAAAPATRIAWLNSAYNASAAC